MNQDFKRNQYDKLKQDYDNSRFISKNQKEKITILKSISKKVEILGEKRKKKLIR